MKLSLSNAFKNIKTMTKVTDEMKDDFNSKISVLNQ